MTTNLDGVKIRVYRPVWIQVIKAEKDGIKGIFLDNLAFPSSHKNYLVITWDFHIYFYTPRLFILIAEEAGGMSQKWVITGPFFPLAVLVRNILSQALTPSFGACGYYRHSLLKGCQRHEPAADAWWQGLLCNNSSCPGYIFSKYSCTARRRDVLFQIHPKHIYCCFCVWPIPGLMTLPSDFSKQQSSAWYGLAVHWENREKCGVGII